MLTKYVTDAWHVYTGYVHTVFQQQQHYTYYSVFEKKNDLMK